MNHQCTCLADCLFSSFSSIARCSFLIICCFSFAFTLRLSNFFSFQASYDAKASSFLASSSCLFFKRWQEACDYVKFTTFFVVCRPQFVLLNCLWKNNWIIYHFLFFFQDFLFLLQLHFLSWRFSFLFQPFLLGGHVGSQGFYLFRLHCGYS